MSMIGNGGGGGGRISVYLGQQATFHGSIQAIGGRGGNSGGHPGSPGTVFIEMDNGDELHRQLHIDGANFGRETECDYSNVLTTANTVHSISDIYLTHRACMDVKAVK